MAVTVTVAPRVQTAAKQLPLAENKVLGEFIRLVVVNGVNPNSAVSTARAHSRPLADADKPLAYGATTELIISSHHRVFYKLIGQTILLTNLVPVPEATT